MNFNEQRLKRIAAVCTFASIGVTLVGSFFVAFLGGPAAAMMALCMVVAVAATSCIAGAGVALLSCIQRVKRDFHG